MSGHSHWHGIRHKKALTDAKKASVFTKFGKLITIASREGGGDPSMNVRLRLVIEQARSANMPKDNIERAIKRGTGELKGEAEIQETLYEGILPVSSGQLGMMILVATDNKNRAVSEIKSLLKKSGAQMVPNGSVAYMFEHIGIIELDEKQSLSKESLETIAIESGVQDIEDNEGTLILYTEPQDVKKIESFLLQEGVLIKSSELGYRPKQTLSLSQEEQLHYDTLLEQLDEQEDVQTIYDNLS
jgi:YebC/PmpR family DNA-binding regulatory protein